MIEDTKKVLKIGSLVSLFLFIVVFGFFRSKNLIFGVQITDVNITDGATVHESSLHITGNAKNALKLSLNDREISLDQSGNFDETIILAPGYNIINIKATDKFKHVDEKNYQLMYQ